MRSGPLARRWELGPAHEVCASGDVLVARCVGRFARDPALPTVFGPPLLVLCAWHIPTNVLLRTVVLAKANQPQRAQGAGAARVLAAAEVAGAASLAAAGARGVLKLVPASDKRAIAPAACLFSVGEKLFIFD